MPINYQQLQAHIKGLGKQALEQQQRLQALREQAFGLLSARAADLPELCALVERAGRENANLRCALPLDEALTSSYACPTDVGEYVILAADGSQINPDRHAALEFGVINTGAFRVQPGVPAAPSEFIRTRLLFGDQLRAEGVPIGEEVVALMRDQEERSLLAELAQRESLPAVTLTDGPLELYREREPGATQLYQRVFKDYVDSLHMLCSMSAVTAGYVDRPGSDLVVRLLELTLLAEEDFSRKAGRQHPLEGVTDASLYSGLLQQGERSALFAIRSPSARNFQGALALHFFYLNVGQRDDPCISRVEVPAWVVEHPSLLRRLHAALAAQCRITSARPFPYALHRAHEVAVVKFDEKAQVEAMLMKALVEQGFAPGRVSNKQFLKDQFGNRTRTK